LTNEKATSIAVRDALGGFLQKPGPDDVVLLYLACHGSPDPRRRENLYLLTYDTDPDRFAGTAVPMREVRWALKENLQARRVVILADTCHSAGLGGAGRRAIGDADAGAVNRFLIEPGALKPGTALLTSAESNDFAQEGKQWGGGHGVFTFFLLKGMERDADDDGDGVVRLGELFEYVKREVEKATDRKQHPWYDPATLDRKFPMSYIGGQSAREHDRIGRQLFELGRYLDERRPFESAAWHLGKAADLYRVTRARKEHADALRMRGLALLAIDADEAAAKSLSDALAQGGDQAPADATFLLGVAQARLAAADRGDFNAAFANLNRFIEKNPDDDRSRWAKQVMPDPAGLKIPGGDRYALLIGAGDYADPNVISLDGPANDVRLMGKLLQSRFAVPPHSITSLTNREATAAAVQYAISRLRNQLKRNDELLIYFSGRGIRTRSIDYGVVLYDARVSGTTSGILDPVTLLDLPSQVTLILDADPPRLQDFGAGAAWPARWDDLPRPQRASACIIFGAQPGVRAVEFQLQSGMFGMFTHFLCKELATSHVPRSAFEVLATVDRKIAAARRTQMPDDAEVPRRTVRRVYGNPNNSFLFRSPARVGVIKQFAVSVRPWSLRAEDDPMSYKLDALSMARGASLPGFHGAIGLTFVERGMYSDAVSELEAEHRPDRARPPDLAVGLATARLRIGGYRDAAAEIRAAASALGPGARAAVEAAAEKSRSLADQSIYALLVGVDNYKSDDVQDLRGAINDVEMLGQALRDRFGPQKVRLTVLENGEATRGAISEAFTTLLGKAVEAPALFYFAGYGSIDGSGRRRIVPVDGREEGVPDIRLDELGKNRAPERSNLVTILDAGWTDAGLGPGGRFLAPDPRRVLSEDSSSAEGSRDVAVARPDIAASTTTFAPPRLGRLTVYADPAREYLNRLSVDRVPVSPRLAFVEQEFGPEPDGSRRYRGKLTRALVQVLNEFDPARLNYATWAERARLAMGGARVELTGEGRDERVLGIATAEAEIAATLAKAEAGRFEELADLLRPLADRPPELAPGACLDLGIAEAAAGDRDAAVVDLEKALASAGPSEKALVRDAHYHLGRVLFEARRDLPRAISELRDAVRADPDEPRARFYRGQAIRVLVDQNLRVEADDDLGTYLKKGAPLGRRGEIERYLESPAPQPVRP
jgi:tetratricopeptide (TPR) repeat protein